MEPHTQVMANKDFQSGMNIEEMARQAEEIADAKTQSSRDSYPYWDDKRNEAFAALVLEQAAQKFDDNPNAEMFRQDIAEAIRAMKPKQPKD